jgi:phosphoketolase
MTPNTLTPDLLCKMDAYWRAANYLAVGQIYLLGWIDRACEGSSAA